MDSLILPKIPLTGVRAASFVAGGGGSLGFSKLWISPNSINALRLAPRPRRGFACLSVSAGGGGGELGGSVGKDSGDSQPIVLIVQGMVCGGCAASVQRILESQPQVASAVVSFDAGTAVVCVHPEAREMENWQKEFGEKLANHLTTCGFKSNLKGKVTEGKVAEA